MKIVVGTFRKFRLKQLVVKAMSLIEWKYVSLLMQCCCDDSEVKKMPAVQHGVVEQNLLLDVCGFQTILSVEQWSLRMF